MFPQLTAAQQEFVISKVKDFVHGSIAQAAVR